MQAREVFNHRVLLAEDAFAEIVAWEIPDPLAGSVHRYKYRLAFVVECMLRYDNEAGKGDHRRIGAKELPYAFSTVDCLVADFFQDVTRWLDENGNP